MSQMLEAALIYARRGWAVFPCRPGTKEPATPNGFKDATTDPECIKRWWARSPMANPAIATGEGSGVWALDPDNHDGVNGLATLADLERQHGSLPRTPAQQTGSGGRHLLFKLNGVDVRNSAGKIGPGIDVRGNGGYIVLPPSVHPCGGIYKWFDDAHPADIEPADAPGWLYRLLDEKPKATGGEAHGGPIHDAYVRAAVEGELGRILTAADGSRNENLNRAAFALGQFIGAGALDRGDAEAQLLRAARAVGLDDKEAVKTINSGIGAGEREPRQGTRARHQGAGGAYTQEQTGKSEDAEGKEDARAPLHVINPADWQGVLVPERRWIVPQWVPFGVATGLYGPPGYGKTLIAQQLMTATALGELWLGCSATRVKTIAFLCEDDEDELHRRQDAINQFYGCQYRDLGDRIRLVPRLGYDNVMMTFKDGRPVRTPFYDQVLDEALSFGAQLVIVDTVADTFGGDQNNMSHARQYVQGLAAIARETDGGVIACAHPSQTGKSSGSGESGSVQWDAAFRSRLYLDMAQPDGEDDVPEENARVLTRKKANYASVGETIDLVWRDGVFKTKYEPTGIIASLERKTCEGITLDIIDQMTRENQWVSVNNKAGNYAARAFMRRPKEDRLNFKTADFERAVQNLLARGELVNEPYGRKGDERYRLARVATHGCGGQP